MQIGAHTCTHPILARLDTETARAEIVRSKTALEALLQREVSFFAYPNGKPGQDYEREHAEIVRDAGFRAAVSTAPGVATALSDCFQLPRFTPWDRTRARFGLRMIMNLTRNRPALA